MNDVKESNTVTIHQPHIKERLKNIIAERFYLPPESIWDDAHFGDDLGIDSIDMTFLLFEIEEEFSLDVLGKEVNGISTVEGMYNLVSTEIQ
ncbi:MAG: acyl carrier protein [Ignavibacteriae bacterium]|nr:acyl carrier protein [Ignavibacteriota bacterium]